MTRLAETPTTVFAQPTTSVAVSPAERRAGSRDAVRLLVATPDGIHHTRFSDLTAQVRPGDLVVVNNSATRAGQLDGRRETGAPVVVHVATHLAASTWVIELRTTPDASRSVLDARPGEVVTSGRVSMRLLEGHPHEGSSPTGHGNRLWRAEVTGDLEALMEREGRPIAYGYLDARYPLATYQSVFATTPGSAEMPSAGRPFTTDLVTDLVSHGVGVAPITLHTGVSSQEAGEGPQQEWYDVPAATADQVNATRARGGRVIAVGTTVTRALESAVVDGRVRAGSGWTERVVTPAHPPQVVTGLVTGWHDPGASHLLLVESVAGARLTQAAYDEATREGYLWHEFGDSALFLPR